MKRHVTLIILLAVALALAVFVARADDSTRISPPELATLTPPSVTAEPYPPPDAYPPPLPPGAFLPMVEGYP